MGLPCELIDPSPDDPLIGQLVAGRYLVRRRLATGGMCAIYELAHRALNRRFALKMLSPETAGDPDALARFWREAEMVAGLCHPNLISILDWDQLEDGSPFLVMELLDGEDLHDRLERTGPLPLREVARIADEVLAGLTVVHRAGIVHRDLKPSNIFLARDDAGGERAVLLDFGISKLRGVETEAGGALVGTPLYMAPEQMDARRAPIGPATDVWAMGAILYEMTTGQRAFDGDTLLAIVHRVCNERPEPLCQLRPDAPRALELLIERALDPDPERRPRDAEQLRRELEPVSEWCAEQSVTDVEIALAPTEALALVPAAPQSSSGSRNDTIRTALFPAPRRRATWIAALVTVLLAFAAAVSLAVALPGGSRHRTRSVRLLADAGKPLRFAVTSSVTPDRLSAQFAPVLSYLEVELGAPIELLVVRDYAELAGRVVRGEVDLAWLPALEYVRATRMDPGLHVLAIPVERAREPHYQGIILAMKGRGIETLADLTGRKFCYVNPSSASGYLYPRELLRQAALDPDTMFREAEFVNEHRHVLDSLVSGRCDAAATYEGVLRNAGREGFRPDRFAVIARTADIPHGPYVAAARMPPERVEQIRRALLALAPESEQSQSVFAGQGDFAGFEAPDDRTYQALRELADRINAPR